MAKGPGVSATSHIIATSQTNVHYYIKCGTKKQEKIRHLPKKIKNPSSHRDEGQSPETKITS
ncbi:hypothetical protein YDYSG_64150 [Paenibacillus tyrfis]|nr:hypothetical protein YDYSG_64150 [Paenibacillus tyrfis]